MRICHNFWLGGSIDPKSTRVSCILHYLFRNTPLDHMWLVSCPTRWYPDKKRNIAQLCANIWLAQRSRLSTILAYLSKFGGWRWRWGLLMNAFKRCASQQISRSLCDHCASMQPYAAFGNILNRNQNQNRLTLVKIKPWESEKGCSRQNMEVLIMIILMMVMMI